MLRVNKPQKNNCILLRVSSDKLDSNTGEPMKDFSGFFISTTYRKYTLHPWTEIKTPLIKNPQKKSFK